MKKKLIKLLVLATFAFAPNIGKSEIDFNDAVDTSAVDALYKKCQEMGSIWQSLTPVVSVPPVVGFEVNKTPLADLCTIVTQMRNYQMRLRELGEKYGLQKQKKDGIELKLLTSALIYSSSFSSMDQKTEKTSRAVVASRKKRGYGAFYKKITGVSLTDSAADPSQSEKTKENIEILERLQNLAGRRAALVDKLNCKTGQNTNFKKVYNEKLAPLQEEFENAENDRDFYFDELKNLASKFKKEREALNYKSELIELNDSAIQLNALEVTKTADGAKRIQQSNGSFKLIPIKQSITVQVFSTREKGGAFQTFAEKWSSNWKEGLKDHVDLILDSLDSGSRCEALIKGDYGDIKSLSDIKPRTKDLISACKRGGANNEKQAAILFDDLIVRYEAAYRKMKAAEAKMLTLESDLLGEPLAPTKSELKNIISEQKPICAEELSVADVTRLQNEALATESELKQIYAESLTKNNKIRQSRLDRITEEDKQRRIQAEITKQKRDEEDRQNHIIPKSVSF